MKGGIKMKRLLVISNEPFSARLSNGRTMMNLLGGYDKESLAQFYLHGTPDTEFCARYFRVSDLEALNAFLHRKSKKRGNPAFVPNEAGAGVRQEQQTKPAVGSGRLTVRRSCRNHLLRDLVWSSNAWWTREFDRFLDAFNPEVVLLQGGDAPFLFALAQKIAKRYNAALVQFTTENYVLKRYMYSGANREKFWHFFLMRRLKRQYAKFMKRAAYCIYSTEQLEEDYQLRYPHPGKSTTIYTVSELIDLPETDKPKNDHFRIVYCGNLGVGRAKPLAELAQVLHEIDPQARLEIYGKFNTEREQAYVCGQPAVEYCGTVDYSAVPDLLRGADMLLHCENASRLENLRTAFSTKIADSLAVGTPFLVYADKRYPFVKYLLKNDCAHVAGNRAELKEILAACTTDHTYRNQFSSKAKETARNNHSAKKNHERFNEIVSQLKTGYYRGFRK